MAHLVEKVTYLEEQLKSKVEQLQMRAGQWFWIKPNQGAAKCKKVGNGWILFMNTRHLIKR